MLTSYKVLCWKVDGKDVLCTYRPGELSECVKDMRYELAEELWESSYSEKWKPLIDELLALYDKEIDPLCEDFRDWLLFVRKYVDAIVIDAFYNYRGARAKALEMNFYKLNQQTKEEKMYSIISWKFNGVFAGFSKTQNPGVLRTAYITALTNEILGRTYSGQSRAPKGILEVVRNYVSENGKLGRTRTEIKTRLLQLLHFNVEKSGIQSFHEADIMLRQLQTMPLNYPISQEDCATVEAVSADVPSLEATGLRTEIEWLPESGEELLVAKTVIQKLKYGDYLSEEDQDLLMAMIAKD